MTAPLTPPECDLTDFAFMPLDVARLRDSELASNETPEACWAAVLLWAASWHQIPAASIPLDEKWIAKAAGYAQRGKIDKEWARVRDGALRGWVECDDGRLYHPVVAEKALEAWQAKLAQRWRTECARIKKHNDRHETAVPKPTFEEWLSLGCPVGHPLPVPGDTPKKEEDKTGDNDSKGQGEGQRQRQGHLEKEKPPNPRKRGRVPDPVFLTAEQLVADGVSEKHAAEWLAIRKVKNLPLVDTAWETTKEEATQAGLSIDNALKYSIERGRAGFRAAWIAQDAAGRGPVPGDNGGTGPSEWWSGPATGIRQKGIELGQGDWDETKEQWHVYRARIFKAAGTGPWNEPPPAGLPGVVKILECT